MTLRRKREKQKQFKDSFLLKKFLKPLFNVFLLLLLLRLFSWLPFSILHFFLSVCLSVCAIFVLLFICVFKSVSACTHNISHSFHLFSWMNEWLFHLCVCSFCVVVFLCDCRFVSWRKRMNKFVCNTQLIFDCLIVSKFNNMFVCFFVWIILIPLRKFVF